MAGPAESENLRAEIESLRAEARYRHERYDLYRPKMYGPRPTTMARFRELEQAHQDAERASVESSKTARLTRGAERPRHAPVATSTQRLERARVALKAEHRRAGPGRPARLPALATRVGNGLGGRIRAELGCQATRSPRSDRS